MMSLPLGTCFSMFVYIRARFRFSLIGGNLTAQSTGSNRRIGGGIQIPDVVASSPSCPHHAARAPRRACSQINSTLLDVTRCIRLHTLLHVVACCWELFCKVWNRSNVWKQCCEFLRPFAPNFKSRLRLNIDVSSVALNILNS